MRLARTLGRTLAELGETMSADEFCLWRIAEEDDPLPDPHFSAALIALTTARSLGGAKNVSLDDFLPRKKPKQSAQEIATRARAWVESLTSRIRRAPTDGRSDAGPNAQTQAVPQENARDRP